MAAPSNEFEHLQAVYRRSINKIVREEFKGINDADDVNLSQGTGVSEASLKYACIHKDNDTAAMTQMRTDLFYFVLRKARDLQAPIYGLPIEDMRQKVRYKPQIQLFFAEPYKDFKTKTRSQCRSEITFRLMQEDFKTITEADLKNYARKIHGLFCTPLEKIKRGKVSSSYTDPGNGYRFKFLTETKGEAKRILQQVLKIQGHEVNPTLLSFHDKEKDIDFREEHNRVKNKDLFGNDASILNPHPVTTIYFQYALFKDAHLANDIVLVDPAQIFNYALVSS